MILTAALACGLSSRQKKGVRLAHPLKWYDLPRTAAGFSDDCDAWSSEQSSSARSCGREFPCSSHGALLSPSSSLCDALPQLTLLSYQVLTLPQLLGGWKLWPTIYWGQVEVKNSQ